MTRGRVRGVAVSATGRAVVVLALSVWGAAAAARSPALAVLAAGLLGVLAVAAVWLALPGVPTVSLTVRPPLVPRDGKAELVVSAANRSRHRRTPLLVGEVMIGSQRLQMRVPALPPGAVHSEAVPLPTGRRGVYRTGPLEVGRIDPFGLARRALRLGETVTLWVHPKRRPLGPVSSAVDAGERAGNPRPGSDEFHSLRPYRRGDDHRLIHWRSTARTLEPMVRHLVDPPQAPRVLGLVDAAGWDREAFEVALEYATGLLDVVDELVTATGQRADAAGDPARALRLLATLEPTPPGPGTGEISGAAIVIAPAGVPVSAEIAVGVAADGAAQVRVGTR